MRRVGGPPRLLRPTPIAPAASRLKPALLLSLQAFDVAVRLGSFHAAATALHLTPSAISHRIRNLERMLGDRLFTRAHRTVQPTSAGKTLAAATGRAFAELVRASAPAERAAAQRRLRISVPPLFGSTWLLPRIAGFLGRHPDIELAIDSSSREVDFDSEPFDAAIAAGDGNWPGLAATHLMDIRVTPVTTPAMAARLKLRTPADLRRATLIHVTAYPLAWPLWFGGAGVDKVEAKQAVWVDSFGAALQLAEQGGGVALGFEALIGPHEQAGALSRPLPFSHPTGSYWLVHRPGDRGHRGLRTFKRWLLAALGRDG